MNLKALLGRAAPPENTPAKPDPVRTAAIVRAEMEDAIASAERLQEKCRDAEQHVIDARRRFDDGMQAYAIGKAPEPNRAEMEAAISKSDALTRVAREQRQRAGQLRNELAEVELSEAIQAGRERLPALTAVAEARLIDFELAVAAVAYAQDLLFQALFNERQGLKQPFASPELTKEARHIRFGLRDKAIAAAKRARFPINPDFETDGNANLGARQDWQVQMALATHKPSPSYYASPNEMGELVPDPEIKR